MNQGLKMSRKFFFEITTLLLFFLFIFCNRPEKSRMRFTGSNGEVKIMTLDPGHFHAALVQKIMYDQVSPEVYIYAPPGPDVQDHLNRINGFNTQADNPTQWKSKVYTSDDFLKKMLAEKPGNVVIISGNNKKKAEYIKACVDAGLNVLADKPMCINHTGFELLLQAFQSAKRNRVLLYDIMTERYEITTMLQKELVNNSEVFGTLQQGAPGNPAVIKESVHHFFKYVAGKPNKRPAWYFDTDQQGEGLVDVTTHLVDLVQWECFPDQAIDYTRDIEMISARHWQTLINHEQFEKVTQLPDFPGFLKAKLNSEGMLPVYANGKLIYKVKDIHVKVSVIWNFQSPEGGGDTHFSIMRGTKADIIIRQGKKQKYRPELYVEVPDAKNREVVQTALKNAIINFQDAYPDLTLKNEGNKWHIQIPDKYRTGHEAHFSQVTKKYLKFLEDGRLPAWEVSNMIAKYYTTTAALEIAK
jgi:predicted dehydrogenase